MDKISVIKEIIALVDYKTVTRFDDQLMQGQFVVTGPQWGGGRERMVGYCVQVRKGRGQFGSDMVFLRHPDGSLVTHENQAFFPMSEHQEKLARSIFAELPESEDLAHGYLCCNKVREVGFIIEKSTSQPSSEVAPFSMTLKSDSGDQCIAFI